MQYVSTHLCGCLLGALLYENAVCFNAYFSRKQVDKKVFLNDSKGYWQSTCSEEIVHRASFLTGEILFDVTSGGR